MPAVEEGVVAGGGHRDDVAQEEGDVVIRPTPWTWQMMVYITLLFVVCGNILPLCFSILFYCRGVVNLLHEQSGWCNLVKMVKSTQQL